MGHWKKYIFDIVELRLPKPGKEKFEFLQCPFEGKTDMHHEIQSCRPVGQCYLSGSLKEQCKNSFSSSDLLKSCQFFSSSYFSDIILYISNVIKMSNLFQFFFNLSIPYLDSFYCLVFTQTLSK